MKYIISLILACLISACSTRNTLDYSSVPANIPDEAKPIWVMLDAATKADIDLLLSACSSEKALEVQQVPATDLFKGLTAFVPKRGLSEVELKVSRSLQEINTTLGIPSSEMALVARPDFAWVLETKPVSLSSNKTECGSSRQIY